MIQMHLENQVTMGTQHPGGVGCYVGISLFLNRAGRPSSKKNVMNSKFCLCIEVWKVEFHSKSGGNIGRDTMTVGEEEEDLRILGESPFLVLPLTWTDWTVDFILFMGNDRKLG